MNDNKPIEVTGRYSRTLYRNQKSGYTCFWFESSDRGSLRCVGIIPKYTEKTPLKLIGHYENDKNGEEIFFVENSLFSFNNKKMLNEYISHNMCPGVGLATADAIRKALEQDYDNIISTDEAAERLKGIKGLDEEKIAVILAKLRSNMVIKKIYEEICPYGGFYSDADELYKRYFNDTISILRKTPYKCVQSTHISFGTIDAYAKNRNFTYYDCDRIKEIVKLAFYLIKNTGCTYVHYMELISIIRSIELKIGAFSEYIPEPLLIFELTQSGYGHIENNNGEICFYDKLCWKAEELAANLVKNMIRNPKILIRDEKIKEMIDNEKELDASQAQCYKILEKTGLNIITGGPGVGKTTTIKKLISKYKEYYPDNKISLCAPSGRAAENMMESSGYPAMTIHMLLEFKSLYGEDNKPDRNRNNPLETDLLIVDEFSMVDIILFSQLLDALKEDCLVIFVGDKNQLKSVGPGKVLEDLLLFGKIPVYELNRIHRQKDGNSIIENSHRIINMDVNLKTDEHFHIIRCNNTHEMMEEYKSLMQKYYNSNNFLDLQALSVMKNGECGIYSANKAAQDILSTKLAGHFYFGENTYYINDKVMTVRNNYDEGYMNGDIGILDDFNPNDAYISLKNGQISIPMDDIRDLTLAYCITVHKSQGSEANKVILLLPLNAPKGLLENAIVYVGVTRAKNEVYILSEEDALEKAIMNKEKSKRKTGFLRKLLSK